jgi:hypothetical protein
VREIQPAATQESSSNIRNRKRTFPLGIATIFRPHSSLYALRDIRQFLGLPCAGNPPHVQESAGVARQQSGAAR